MFLSQILSGIPYKLYGVKGNTPISRPFSHSKNSVRGGLFICIKGAECDGADYVREALSLGAVAVLSDREIYGVPLVLVRDVRSAAAAVWNNFYHRPAERMRLYGITGTNGKTSTAAFLASCLSESGRCVGTIGTLGAFVNSEEIETGTCEKKDCPAAMTTPDPEYLYGTLARFSQMGVTDVVMEVSSHGIVQRKTDPLSFDLCAFTNLSPEHLDFHGNMEDYFRAKASFVSRGVVRVVNADDPYCRDFLKRIPSEAVGSVNMSDICTSCEGVSYTLCYKGRTLHIKSALCGDFTLYNTLIAAVSALHIGVPQSAVEKGIAKVGAVKGRLERVIDRRDEGFDLYIDFAHTPDAMERVLSCLKNITQGRLICVFGCGGDRDKGKRPVMGEIAQRLCDVVIVTSDNPRSEDRLAIIRDIIAGMSGRNSVVIPDRREAVFAAVATARARDTVILCGKGHETYEIGPFGMREFDEREVVKAALKKKRQMTN